MMEGEKNRETQKTKIAMGKYATVEGARSQEWREDTLRWKDHTGKDKRSLQQTSHLLPYTSGSPQSCREQGETPHQPS